MHPAERRYLESLKVREWAEPFASRGHMRDLDRIIENRRRIWQSAQIVDAIARPQGKAGQLSFGDIKRAHATAPDE